MDSEHAALLIMDLQPELVGRLLCEKVFPRQATVTTVDAWIATLG